MDERQTGRGDHPVQLPRGTTRPLLPAAPGAMSRPLTHHNPARFREDAPRPPVPGEEGQAPCYPSKLTMMRPQGTTSLPLDSAGSSTRRNQDGLGEPEGSASPASPLSRWTKSLHSLLGDQDGAQLFRIFLDRERCVDSLDFWFACNGFRQMDLKDPKTQRVAKAIYKRYIENSSIVAMQLKPATKTFIRDHIKKQMIDSAMFDQAQTEIQATMEEKAYQMFLTSEVYLDYVRTGGENPSHAEPSGLESLKLASLKLGSLKLVCGFLPTLNEEEEWSCNHLKGRAPASRVGLSAQVALRTVEVMEKGYRSYRGGDSGKPYHVGSFAPATSTNESEASSDAMTDDSMSLTDSSVDGIPPYKLASKKHLQREMQRNMRMNSQVSLPAFPRSRRAPQEMAPVQPVVFAAQLIARLESLKREQETMSSLEERLQQIQEEEERDEAELSSGSVPLLLSPHSLPLAVLPPGHTEEDAQAILDEHLSRVLKTPGCQSPAAPGRHSPRSRSPEHRPLLRGEPGIKAHASPGAFSGPSQGAFTSASGPGRALLSRQSTKHIHHHYIHHHAGPRSQEQMEREAALRVQCLGPAGAEAQAGQRSRSLGREMCGGSSPDSVSSRRSSSLSRWPCFSGAGEDVTPGCGGSAGPAPLLLLPTDSADRSQNVWQWILESERQSRHKSHSTQSTKKSYGVGASSSQTHTWGGGGNCAHLRSHQPAHPFVQDPAMPPLPPPNTLAQLEEARRRLEEVSKPPKQRHTASTLQRERSHLVPVQNGGPSPLAHHPAGPALGPGLQSEEGRESRRAAGLVGGETVVTYFFCGEEIPYRRSLKTHCLTLGHFKEQLRKKGNYRYYFKKPSSEFECGAVFEEVYDDSCILPTYEGKILGKVERMD